MVADATCRATLAVVQQDVEKTRRHLHEPRAEIHHQKCHVCLEVNWSVACLLVHGVQVEVINEGVYQKLHHTFVPEALKTICLKDRSGAELLE